MKTKSIFLDGRMVKARAKLIDSLAPGVVQGKGVFETMRVVRGKIFALEEHFDRLFRGMRALKVRSPYSRKQWKQYLYNTVRINAAQEAGVRLAVWMENRHLRIAIVCRDIKSSRDHKYEKGLRAAISKVKRKKSRYSNIKSLDYLCFRRAFEEAQNRGFDEAILLNNRNEIVEGSRTNVFYVKKGILYTPAAKCGCLNGITRRIVLRCARRLRIPCRAVAADVRKLFQADEAFVTNALIGVMPLTNVEDRIIGRGTAGPLTKKLLCAYNTNVHSSCPP